LGNNCLKRRDYALMGLLDSLKIGELILKNRIVMPPMYTGLATTKGEVTDELVNHYVLRCKALGLVIIEHSYVAVEGKLSEKQLGVYDEDLIPGLLKLSSRVQDTGTPVVLQISHAGSRTISDVTGIKPVSSSANDGARELQIDEINALAEGFAKAAQWGIKAGFDGIEVHGAHGFLLNQFTSPLTNQRCDGYGGSLENRLRFPLEVVRRVKEKVGKKLLFYRLGSDDRDPCGTRIWDSQKFAVKLEKAGVDLIDVSGGICGSRPEKLQGVQGYFVPQAIQIKKVVNVPVIGVGGIKEVQFADKLIQQRKVDLVAIGRQLFKDPDWGIKAIELLRKD
jgi:2,4-dienoyl-CoA reductase-like NADH-dependent reductase (Old Yellow Enzyme family)